MKIKGKVQGVFFRASTRETAQKLGIRGWVRNLSDGTVETVAEGDSDALEKFIDWCKKGPESAMVTDVDIDMQTATGKFDNFTIEYNQN